jgi:hypothetical protein
VYGDGRIFVEEHWPTDRIIILTCLWWLIVHKMKRFTIQFCFYITCWHKMTQGIMNILILLASFC